MKKYMKKEADVTAVVYDKQTSKKLASIIGALVSISGNAWEEHQFITIGDNKNIPIKDGDYIVKDDGKFRVIGAVQFEADYELLKENERDPKTLIQQYNEDKNIVDVLKTEELKSLCKTLDIKFTNTDEIKTHLKTMKTLDNKSNNTGDKEFEAIEKGLADGTLKFEDMPEDVLRLYAKSKKIRSAHNMLIEKLITKLNEETK